MEAPKKKTITIERTFDMPVDKVWKAFSDSEQMKKWFSPKDFTTPSSSIDFREGGKYLNSMKGADGKETWSTGTFKEIIHNRKIVYSDSFSDSNGNIVSASYYNMPGNWDDALQVSVEFEEKDGRTKMKLTHEGLPNEAADDCKEGWQQCFDKLESNLK